MATNDAGSLPSEAELKSQLADLPADQLRSLLGTETPQGEALLAGEGIVAKEAARPTEATEPPPTEAAAPTEAPADESDKLDTDEGPKRRVRPRTDLDHQVLDLYKSEGFKGSFQNAVDIIYGNQRKDTTGSTPENEAGGETPPTQNTPTDPTAEIDAQVETLTREMAELEKKIDEAAEEMKTTEALRLQRDLTRKEQNVSKLRDLKENISARKQDQVRSAFSEKASVAKTEALERFPVLANKNSIERKQFDAYLDKAQADAELAPLFNSSRWPLLLAEEFARNHGLNPAAKKSSAASPAPNRPNFDAPNPRASEAKVLTSGDTPPATNAAPSEKEFRELLPKLTPAQLRELMQKTG